MDCLSVPVGQLVLIATHHCQFSEGAIYVATRNSSFNSLCTLSNVRTGLRINFSAFY
jgi:hypothetical protein